MYFINQASVQTCLIIKPTRGALQMGHRCEPSAKALQMGGNLAWILMQLLFGAFNVHRWKFHALIEKSESLYC